ncbi:MAG: DNA integrity scanning protein DisA nucleotide-binding domain protein, partial [Deltaproteobacteria bacterium]|nr:DNA integrity scanning protein DisA nucleotide-binding domain protein [Deltaproteobacteria bacterium]
LLKGTTALQITLGLVSLWIFHAIAQAIGLVLTSWFFQGLGTVAVLVIVVVFRNEIRDILIQTSPVRFFLGRPQETRSIDVASIAETAFRLAGSRTGALIVIQNRDRLASHLREGIHLDGRYDPQIIESIFNKHSPVHDGAIVVRGNRIVRVATYLPLTQREGLPSRFGTRHRAAIGLSELTDAVVLVVSEERGQVSVVHRGKVELTRDPLQLKEELDQLLLGIIKEVVPRSRTKIWLTQTAGFVLTFFLVSTVWGIYSGKQLSSLITVTTPIDFRNLPENLELKKASTDKVEVQITGRRRLVSALKPNQVSAFVDLRNISNGVHTVVLDSDNIELPLGLRVVRVTPSRVKLELERRIIKELVVEPHLVGKAPPGFKIVEIRPEPDVVKLSGGESVLRYAKRVRTAPVDLDALAPEAGEKTFKAPLVLTPSSLHLVEGQPKEIQVTIKLAAKEPPASAAVARSEAKRTRYYQVRTGDTLWAIGRRFGLTVEQLQKLNKLGAAAVIHPGQRLIIGGEPAAD